MTPPITIIAPAHNEEGSIRVAIRNLLELDYPELELLVEGKTWPAPAEGGRGTRKLIFDAPDESTDTRNLAYPHDPVMS